MGLCLWLTQATRTLPQPAPENIPEGLVQHIPDFGNVGIWIVKNRAENCPLLILVRNIVFRVELP